MPRLGLWLWPSLLLTPSSGIALQLLDTHRSPNIVEGPAGKGRVASCDTVFLSPKQSTVLTS